MSIERIVRQQAGVIALRQAVREGLSSRTAQRRVASGAWLELLPQVYPVSGHRRTDEGRVRSTWLWAGGAPAAVTGPAAGYWHGMLDAAPALVEITVPRATHRTGPPGVVVRRRDLHATDLVEHRDLLVAGRPLAAIESAVVLPDGSAFLDRALQRHVPFSELYDCYCRNLGRRGWKRASQLIAAAADRADSAAERVLKRLLREAGLTGWVLGHRFGPYLIDLAFPAQQFAIEVDGWAWHVDVDRFRADRRKGNALTRAGWTLLRFTWTTWSPGPARWSQRSSMRSKLLHDRRKRCHSDRSVALTPLAAISPSGGAAGPPRPPGIGRRARPIRHR